MKWILWLKEAKEAIQDLETVRDCRGRDRELVQHYHVWICGAYEPTWAFWQGSVQRFLTVSLMQEPIE